MARSPRQRVRASLVYTTAAVALLVPLACTSDGDDAARPDASEGPEAATSRIDPHRQPPAEKVEGAR
ncbi:MAG TPA: hypothetical protein VH419_05985, partial [Nocardioidaceae bacterium]